MKKLFFRAGSKFLLGVLLSAALLFLPAGTLHYPAAWRFLAVVFLPIAAVGAILLCRAPELLEKRLNTKETQREQTTVVKLSALMFLAGFVTAGLNFRFGWILLPEAVSWAACGVFLLSYLLYALVLRENPFLSRTVEVQDDQRVIDTGLYSIVRHPMYSATVLLFLSMPLILGSLPSFALFLAYPVLIAARIRSEEAVLEEGLEGYAEYKQKVVWRLIPLIW